MRRIAVVGCSGGGKSTLARALGERLRLPVIHLDTLFWKPGWVERDPEVFRAAVDAAAAADAWVTDGNFTTASATTRFPRADTVVWIERPMLHCLWRAFWRAASALGRERADLAPGCPERIDLAFYRYIWAWNRTTRPKMQRALDDHAPQAKILRLRSDGDITQFLAGVRNEATNPRSGR